MRCAQLREEIDAAARGQAEAQREAEREGAWAATRREAGDVAAAARTAALREACTTADAARSAAEAAASSGAVALRAAEAEVAEAWQAAESRAREAVATAQVGCTPLATLLSNIPYTTPSSLHTVLVTPLRCTSDAPL